MKRTLLFILISICSIQISIAQFIQGTSRVGNGGSFGDVKFGIKAGLGISTGLFRDYENLTNRPSFSLGGLAEIPAFFDNFYLQPEFMIQLVGAKISGENLVSWYGQVPIIAKYHITDRIAAEFGPQVSFLIAENWDQNVSIVEFEKVGIGLNIGGGYRLNENLYFNLRVGTKLSGISSRTNTRDFNFLLGANYFF